MKNKEGLNKLPRSTWMLVAYLELHSAITSYSGGHFLLRKNSIDCSDINFAS